MINRDLMEFVGDLMKFLKEREVNERRKMERKKKKEEERWRGGRRRKKRDEEEEEEGRRKIRRRELEVGVTVCGLLELGSDEKRKKRDEVERARK